MMVCCDVVSMLYSVWRKKSKGSYNFSKNIIQPLVDKRSEVLNSIRQNVFSNEDTISLVKEGNNNLIEGIQFAKNCWSNHLADRIHQMATNSKDS